MSSKKHLHSTQEGLDTSNVQSANPTAIQKQQAYGNSFLAEQMNAQTYASGLSTESAKRREGEASSTDNRAADLDVFRSTKFPQLREYRWGDDNRGLFDVGFDARSGTLTIALRVSYQFKDGDPSKFPYFDPQEFVWSDKEKKKFKKLQMM